MALNSLDAAPARCRPCHRPTSAQHDLVRIPMTMTTLPSPVEQMTIALESQGDGATLKVMWDATQASVPIRAR